MLGQLNVDHSAVTSTSVRRSRPSYDRRDLILSGTERASEQVGEQEDHDQMDDGFERQISIWPIVLAFISTVYSRLISLGCTQMISGEVESIICSYRCYHSTGDRECTLRGCGRVILPTENE